MDEKEALPVFPLPDRLGLIALSPADAQRLAVPQSERAAVERSVADINRRADRVRRAMKLANETLEAFGRKDRTVQGADACVQRTFAARSYASANEALAAATSTHDRAAKALETIVAWLKSPVGFTGGAADFRLNGKAHDLSAMERDAPSSPDGPRVEDLESWIDRARRHIQVLVAELPEHVGLVALAQDERHEVPGDLASEWEAKRELIDEMARDIRTLARTLSRDSTPDDVVLKRAPEAVQGEFERTRPHDTFEVLVEKLVDAHKLVRAQLGPIGKVLYPEAGGKSEAGERNEAAIAEACAGEWIPAESPFTCATLEEWRERASAPIPEGAEAGDEVGGAAAAAPTRVAPKKETRSAAPSAPSQTASSAAAPPKSRAPMLIGVAAAVLVLGGGGFAAFKMFSGNGSKSSPTAQYNTVFKPEHDQLAAFAYDPRAAQAESTARAHFEGTSEKWDEARTREYLTQQIAQLRPAPANSPAFNTKFASLLRMVDDEFASGPGEADARAAQRTAQEAYQKNPATADAIASEFRRSLTLAKRKFDIEFAPLLRQADATPGAAADQHWIDEKKKQVAAWNAGKAEHDQVADALSTVLSQLAPLPGGQTPFATVWAKEPTWSKDPDEANWQLAVWNKLRGPLEQKRGSALTADGVTLLEADKAEAFRRLSSVGPVAAGTPDELKHLGSLSKLFEDRVDAMNAERRKSLEAYATGASTKVPEDPSSQRQSQLAFLTDAEEALAALKAGWALDETPPAPAWTGSDDLRKKLRSVLARKTIPATDLGLDAWASTDTDAPWPASSDDAKKVPAEHQRSAWRTTLHRRITETMAAKGATPDHWTSIQEALDSLATTTSAEAQAATAQKLADATRFATLLDAYQPATGHAALLGALDKIGPLPPPGAQDTLPLVRTNLALHKLVGKPADQATLDLLKHINDTPALSNRAPDAKRLYAALTARPMDTTPPQGWKAAQGSLSEDTVLLHIDALNEDVGFVYLKSLPGSAGERIYLAADEMSAGLLVAALNKSPPPAKVLPAAELDGDLPRSWVKPESGPFVLYAASGFETATVDPGCVKQDRRPWLGKAILSNCEAEVYPKDRPLPPQPTADSPAQLVSANFAQAVAASLHVRLPTPEEWVAALAQAAPTFESDGGAPAFLCGDRWPPNTFQRIGSPAVFDSPPGGTGARPDFLFEPTTPRALAFRHLIGNVAEVAAKGSTFQAMGGSAYALQSKIQLANLAKPLEPDPFMPDLGIRLAFSTSAPKPPPTIAAGDLLVSKP
jgi:hypothetical protein